MPPYRTAGINISNKFTASICSAEVGSSSNLLSHTRLHGVITQNNAPPGNPTTLQILNSVLDTSKYPV
jgi:hypothetical protein